MALFFDGEVFELGYFANGEVAELAWRDVEFQGPELDAFDFFDQEADRLEHAADLAVAAFDEGNFVPRVGGVFLEADFGGRGFHPAVVVEGDVDAGAEALNGGFVWTAVDLDEIGFGDVRGGLGELLDQSAVVGEQKKTFRRVVKAADRIDASIEIAEQVEHCGAAFGVARGGDVAFRFVKHEVDGAFGGFDASAIDKDGVGRKVGFGTELGDHFAVDRDAPGEDEFLGFATGGDAGRGEEFLKALGHGRVSSYQQPERG